MIDPNVLIDKLMSLASPSDIVDFMEEQGVKGLLGDSSQCVLAQWLRRESGQSVVVNGQDISWQDGPEGRWKYHEVETNETIESFVYAFDNKEFPTLIDFGEDWDE